MLIITTNSGTEKYKVVAEDFDSFVVAGIDKPVENGFLYTNRYETEASCMIIKKDQVDEYYNEWEDTYDLYKGIRVDCYEEDGKVEIEVSDVPEELEKEFTREEYLDYARGDNYPPFNSVRYLKTVDADDPDLKMEVCELCHKNLEVNNYGIVPGISSTDYDRLHMEYLADMLDKSDSGNNDPIYRLFLGCYGFAYPGENGLQDLDVIFEKIIPLAYQKLVDEGTPYGAKNFIRELGQCAFRRRIILEFNKDDIYTVLMDGKKAELPDEYIYYSYLQRALKIKKYHEAGMTPYNILDLTNVWYWFDKECSDYLENTNPVVFNGLTLCDNLGEYVKNIRGEMEYYRQFDSHSDN